MTTKTLKKTSSTIMTTDTTAIGYVNGILYLGHDDNAQVELYNKNCISNNSNSNNNSSYNNNTSNNTFVNETRQKLNVDIADNDNDNDVVAAAAAAADDDDDDRNNHDGNDKSNSNGTNNGVSNFYGNDADADSDADETDSFASMETLSDNVSIWIDGEKHWVSGVDATTTCADLILALLNYQDEQQQLFTTDDHNHQHAYNTTATATATATTTTNANTMHAHGQNNKRINKNTNNNNNNSKSKQSPNQHQNQNNACTKDSNKDAINQSLQNTKENFKSIDALLSEYVIVKQHRHCEEYLDGSTKVFDVLPTRDMPDRKECELLLRRLVIAAPHMNTQVASLLSTDKDSGMGSPVGSSRSAKFRRKKYKATTATSSHWLAQSNTLHPKLSQKSSCANERLLKIILAQDETIHRQLTLLREKERQILKIEEEKHRVRERELGKNYLLETYLNGLDEADIEKDYEDGIEIFIDEEYETLPLTAAKATAAAATTTTDANMTAAAATVLHMTTNQRRERKQRKDFFATAGATAAMPTTTTTAVNLKTTFLHNVEAVPHSSTQSKTIATAAVNNTVNNNNSNNNSNNNNNNNNSNNEKDIELTQQILWLEKVYAINKRLQREEEQLLKLHAKIRKHQVKRAYQTKHEVIEQIDKLDNELALQCDDIRQVEDNLHMSNEQLKHKLFILEKLSQELFCETNQTAATPPAATQTQTTTRIPNEAVMADKCTASARQILSTTKPIIPTTATTTTTTTKQSNNCNVVVVAGVAAADNKTHVCLPTSLECLNSSQQQQQQQQQSQSKLQPPPPLPPPQQQHACATVKPQAATIANELPTASLAGANSNTTKSMQHQQQLTSMHSAGTRNLTPQQLSGCPAKSPLIFQTLNAQHQQHKQSANAIAPAACNNNYAINYGNAIEEQSGPVQSNRLAHNKCGTPKTPLPLPLLVPQQPFDKNMLPMQLDKTVNKEMFSPKIATTTTNAPLYPLPSANPLPTDLTTPIATATATATTITNDSNQSHGLNEYVNGHVTTALRPPAVHTKLEHNVDITCLGTLV